jgi:hypothetical protein
MGRKRWWPNSAVRRSSQPGDAGRPAEPYPIDDGDESRSAGNNLAQRPRVRKPPVRAEAASAQSTFSGRLAQVGGVCRRR